jgi:hypothetical protein
MGQTGWRYAYGNITENEIFLLSIGLNFSRGAVTGAPLEKEESGLQCRASFPHGEAVDGKDVCQGRQIGKD